MTQREGLVFEMYWPLWLPAVPCRCAVATLPRRAATRANTSHLRPGDGERIKQVDKIEKPLSRLKGSRRRHVALLGFMLVVDLLDLTSVDAKATLGQDVLGHLVTQANQQRGGGLLRLQGESQRDCLGQFKESLAKT